MDAPVQDDHPPRDLTDEEWVIYVFDRPVSWARQEWYWDADHPAWCLDRRSDARTDACSSGAATQGR